VYQPHSVRPHPQQQQQHQQQQQCSHAPGGAVMGGQGPGGFADTVLGGTGLTGAAPELPPCKRSKGGAGL
jgi:hypothetical protein